MSTLKKRKASEDKERAEATLPTQRWWVSVVTWVLVALVIGAVSMLIAPSQIDATPDRWTLARYLAVALFNVVVMFAAPYYAARQVLARRGIKEIWQFESNKRALNRVGLPTVLTVLGFIIITSRGTVSESLYTGLLTFSTVFAIYRALTTAYTAHYLDYVVSPREVRENANDRELKGRRRVFLERAAVTVGVRFPRERLVMPLIQTLFVAFALRILIALAWSVFGGDVHSADQAAVVQIISPSLTVISAVLWAIWHLHGGTGKILRISNGRSMKSFGWANPGFTKGKKMV